MRFSEIDYRAIRKQRPKNKKLDTLSNILNKEYNQIIKKIKDNKEIRDIINFSIEQQKEEKVQKETVYREKKEKNYYQKPEELKPKFSLYKYYTTNLNKNYNYFSTGSYSIPGINIIRVPSSVLGDNVLGCAFLGRNLVYIRQDLQGSDFEEVKKHEINHILYPHFNEWQIRSKTRSELPFYGRYH
jgi:hypothetical protein|tara:strand:+ start:60 stop:617 length:558 start_codon:yes stop_codon:yes gene_type:complete